MLAGLMYGVDEGYLRLPVAERLAQLLERMDRHNPGLGMHAAEVATLSVQLGEKMELPLAVLQELYLGALLHDLGKLSVPAEILNKAEKLTPAEVFTIQRHPVLGTRHFLTLFPHLGAACQAILTHHERWNGSGYPQHLQREAIPLTGRIVAVVDVYTALLSPRPYRPAWDKADARRFLLDNAGILFDPLLVHIFLNEVL